MFDLATEEITAVVAAYGLAGAAVLGVTQVAKKAIPQHLQDEMTPLLALVMGVLVVCALEYEANTLDVLDILKGVVLGGAATGLYAVRKETSDSRSSVDIETAQKVEVKQGGNVVANDR